MRGAALPAALLCAALGLMLAFAPRKAVLAAIPLLVAIAASASLLPVPPSLVEAAFLGCWASLIVLALLVHLPRGVPQWLALIAAADAGAWCGLIISAQGNRLDLPRALPCVALVVPAGWFVTRGWPIPVKVLASWLIAVALLAALLPTVATPGYVPDHMD